MMNWSVAIIGILCCISGIYLFYKNAFEENNNVRSAFLLMLVGVTLIGWFAAKQAGLIM